MARSNFCEPNNKKPSMERESGNLFFQNTKTPKNSSKLHEKKEFTFKKRLNDDFAHEI